MEPVEYQPLSIYQRATCYLLAIPIEVAFNALNNLRKGDLRAQGKTQLWVYPVYYVFAVNIFEPLHERLRHQHAAIRLLGYSAMFLSLEWISGRVARSIIGRCPWEYKDARFASPDKIVNFAYAPFWGMYGLVAEQAHDMFASIRIPKS